MDTVSISDVEMMILSLTKGQQFRANKTIVGASNIFCTINTILSYITSQMDCFSGLTNRRKQYQKIFGKVQYILFAALDHKNKAVCYSGFSTDIMVHGALMPELFEAHSTPQSNNTMLEG